MDLGVPTPLLGALACLALPVLAVLIWAALTFNRLIRQRNQADASWAQIDVQLKRRHDLVPNLVETVRAYAQHERATLETVIAARGAALNAVGSDESARADAENVLGAALGRLFALSEAYPDLKANQNFLGLQRELAVTEDKIAYARQFFNSAVQTLNTTVQSVPSNLVARIAGFRVRAYFETADRDPVRIRF